ncbi:MAG: DUF4386 domain-containing protein [Ignavibacteriae bacterium]|nr:DUF4386 domain-containing protein [Ignavibacteriota bacterium]
MATSIDDSQRKALRSAGLLYFLMALTAPVGLMFVPSSIIVSGDATATADQLRASEWLLRLGIGSELLHQSIAVFLVLSLYRLFKPVSEYQAKLLVMLGALVSVPIMFANVLNEIAALVLVSGANFLSAFDKSQIDAAVLFFLSLHGEGITVASVFWGLWLFPFGMLVIRSGFVPRFLGYLLFAAGSGYLLFAVTSFLLPQYEQIIGQVAMILEFGELPILFWLFIKAIRPSGILRAQ